MIPRLVTQVGELADDIPGAVDDIATRDDAIGRYVRENDVAEKLQTFVKDLPTKITNSFGTIVGVAGKVGSVIFNIVTVAILTIYFMLSLPRMRRTAAIAFAPDTRERAEDVMDQAISRIGGYVAGILTTASIAGTLRARVLHDPGPARLRDSLRGAARGVLRSPGADPRGRCLHRRRAGGDRRLLPVGAHRAS